MGDQLVRSGSPSVGNHIRGGLQSLRNSFNYKFCYEPIILVGGTAIVVHLVHCAYHRVPNDGLVEGVKRYIFKLARKVPYIKRQIKAEVDQIKETINTDMLNLMKGDSLECHFILQLPCQGLKSDEIITKLHEYLKLGHYSWEDGSVSGTVYHGGEQLTALNTKVFEASAWTNPLHPDVFPGVCKMEAEVVRMVAELFHGNSRTCGTVTSGGTESILLAVKAYRDWARDEKGIMNPEILVPKTVHAAFDKAAQLLGIKIRHVPVNPDTCKVDLRQMHKMINGNTCLLVGSAPAFPHGCIDDIKTIADFGVKYDIPVHVDACLGGFLIAFMPQAGFPLKPFDFRLSGVTSISADTHKYGFAPKGSSVLLFRDIKYKHKQYFLQSDWPGGLYGSPTLAGSRPGTVIAGCWSSLLFFGMNGYIDTTRRIVSTTRKIEDGLRKMRGICVMGKPEVSVVAVQSKEFDIYRLSDAMNKKGWNLNNLQFPSSIHLCVTYCHTEPGVAERFLADVAYALEIILKNPEASTGGSVAMYGSAQKIPDRSLVQEITAIYLDSLYNTDCNIVKPKWGEGLIGGIRAKMCEKCDDN